MKEAVSVFMQRRRQRGETLFLIRRGLCWIRTCWSVALLFWCRSNIRYHIRKFSHFFFPFICFPSLSPAPLTAHCVHDTKSFLQKLFDRGQNPELLLVLRKERRESKWSQWKVDSSGRAKETRQRLWLKLSYHQLNVCFPPPRSSVLPRAPTFCLTWGKIHMNFLSQKIVFFVNFDTQ